MMRHTFKLASFSLARTALRDAPNLSVPDDVIDAGGAGGVNKGLEQFVSDDLLLGIARPSASADFLVVPAMFRSL